MRVRNSTDCFDAFFDPFVGHQSADHENDKSIRRKSNFLSMGTPRPETITINTIRYKSGAPSCLVSFVELGVCTYEAVTAKVAVLGFLRKCRPVTIFRCEDMAVPAARRR